MINECIITDTHGPVPGQQYFTFDEQTQEHCNNMHYLKSTLKFSEGFSYKMPTVDNPEVPKQKKMPDRVHGHA